MLARTKYERLVQEAAPSSGTYRQLSKFDPSFGRIPHRKQPEPVESTQLGAPY